MLIKNLTLKNFRNHPNLNLTFKEGTTLILGDNGVGKTNILEAINILSLAKSNRTRYDRDLIAHSKDFCTITGHIDKNNEEIKLELAIVKLGDENKSTKKVKVNGVARTHVRFIGNLHTVSFAATDIQLITGSPTIRRHYVDTVVAQVDDKYKKNLVDYKKILVRRNKVLEGIYKLNSGHSQLKFWNDQLLEKGKLIQKARKDFFDIINEVIIAHVKDLDPNINIKLNYLENELSQEVLSLNSQLEIKLQKTLFGPHRDDFVFEMNKYNASNFSSRGQKRTILLALKLSEVDFFVTKVGIRPVVLLDDIFSELDPTHKDAVIKTIGQQQTIVTSAEEIDLPADIITLK